MTLAIVYSRASSGISAPLVTVEVHLSQGMAGFHMVGLPEAAVKESRDRVRSALVNSRFEFPIKHITVNLAPADLPKEGGRFDLPIALGVLAASGQIPAGALANYEFAGELALSGELRPVRGMLPVVLSSFKANRQLIVPAENMPEATLVPAATVLGAKHLLEVCAHLRAESVLLPCAPAGRQTKSDHQPDLADVKGQPQAKRALEVAAAGQHSLLLVGPPGTGKTMLASRLPSILPEISEEEALEVASIASVSSRGFKPEAWRQIPFRAPHHSSSSVALVGGGRPPRPGEVSLAHRGILFLDELPEFSRPVLECLREPLEMGSITISRAAFQTMFPANFQLIAAMNPCPCGYAGSSLHQCQCHPEQVKRYRGKISGPLLDRIDMHVAVNRLPPEVLAISSVVTEESSDIVRARVVQGRERQLRRQGKPNALLTVPELECYAAVETEALRLLNQAMQKLNLSARAYHRVIKLARTLADLAGEETIKQSAISEALQFRYLDRQYSV